MTPSTYSFSQAGSIQPLNISSVSDIPSIILSVSPCRSGSTVMLRIMGAMGVQSYFQPLKNLLRWQIYGQPQQWSIPCGKNEIVYLKETLGPYSIEESTFNPLSFLIDSGVPPQKIHLWLYGRHPLACYTSWQKWWHGRTTINRFIESYYTCDQIYHQAQAAGISTSCLTYEAFKQYPPDMVVKKIANRFNLTYTPTAIKNWDTCPKFGHAGSNVFLPIEPEAFISPKIHDSIHNASEFTYSETEHIWFNYISTNDQDVIADSGLFALYDQWHEKSNHWLNLCD